MKIIDKTPFQKPSGELDVMGRLQGMLKYGFGWPGELEAQQAAVAQLQRSIDKGFVLIRNLTLPGSEVIIPILLLGTHGLSVIYVTPVRGFFEAKGEEWNTVKSGQSLPANVNLIGRVRLLTRAVQLYLQRQGLDVVGPAEPVLIGTDPGFHVETTRPSVRVVMSDAIRQFGGSLVQARPILKSQQVYDLADRIVTPRPPQEQAPAEAEGPARAKAIFDAAESPGGEQFDSSELSFAFDDGQDSAAAPDDLRAGLPAGPVAGAAARKGRVAGMTPGQLVFLAVMALVECCVLVGGGYYLFVLQP
jgi:hypothetical protein